jgi:hypothetical protein
LLIAVYELNNQNLKEKNLMVFRFKNTKIENEEEYLKIETNFFNAKNSIFRRDDQKDVSITLYDIIESKKIENGA